MNQSMLSSAKFPRMISARCLSGITYSGGQAFEGQGGFYGSGGSRAKLDQEILGKQSLTIFLAMACDVECVSLTIKELNQMENLLRDESEKLTLGRNIELRNKMKKMMTAEEFLKSLSQLEIKGQPVWGLSQSEREMIILAQDKVSTSLFHKNE